MLELIEPFVRALGGKLWHDTFAIVIPPLGENKALFEYYGGMKPAILFYLYPGDAREYNPDTGEIGVQIRTMDAGFYHEHPGWMNYHIDPLVESFIKHNPYMLLAYLTPGKPHRLWMYNRTDKHIWFDITIWLAEFEKERVEIGGVERSIDEWLDLYLKGKAYYWLWLGRMLERRRG